MACPLIGPSGHPAGRQLHVDGLPWLQIACESGQEKRITEGDGQVGGYRSVDAQPGSRVSNTTFTSPEYKRLKSEFVRLRTFQEAWIPAIKAGGFSRFALYDLKADPLQKKDISRQRPEVTNRLKKKLLTLYKDVMADAPDWPSK